VMNPGYVMLMSINSVSATGRVQCVWSPGEEISDSACIQDGDVKGSH
jgi:hypothetical protein